MCTLGDEAEHLSQKGDPKKNSPEKSTSNDQAPREEEQGDLESEENKSMTL